MAALGVAAVVPMLAAGAIYAHKAATGPAARHESYSRSQAPSPPGICAAPSDPALASRLSAGLGRVLQRRSSTVALAVDDRRAGLTCRLGSDWRLDSASLVKLTILCALLRMHMDEHQYLTQDELNLTAAMITASDGSATSALWQQVGPGGLQHFLTLAGMRHTIPGPGGYWGLTQITAGDEMTLLKLLTTGNHVLDSASREFALKLISGVIPAQRWGVPAGAPGGGSVGVQDGWMPRRQGDWRVNSIGVFTGRSGDYEIVVLTRDNSTMAYGITTIEDAAEVLHRDLNPGAGAAIPPSRILPLQQTPDEELPPLPQDP